MNYTYKNILEPVPQEGMSNSHSVGGNILLGILIGLVIAAAGSYLYGIYSRSKVDH